MPWRRPAAEYETRNHPTHDFVHYAVEAEADVQSGVWGRLAAGATLAEMNDRTRSMPVDDLDVVGAGTMLRSVPDTIMSRQTGW